MPRYEPPPVPESEWDPAIVNLCHAINEFPDLATNESCQGFVDGHREGEPWAVYLKPSPSPPTPAGYASIEFLAHLINGAVAVHYGFKVRMGFNAAPPYLNGPAETLYFYIEGNNKHPDEFAAFLREQRESCFYLPGDSEETQ